MNFLRRNIFSKIILTAIAVITGLNLASCDSFNEQLEPCPQGARLRFVYDYNMEFANAFPSQVDCLTLLVYDKTAITSPLHRNVFSSLRRELETCSPPCSR